MAKSLQLKRMHRQKGFTLAEFSAVVALTSFVIVSAIPRILEDSAHKAALVTEEGIRILTNAAVSYRTDERYLYESGAVLTQYGEWPASVDDLLGPSAPCGTPRIINCTNYLGVFENRNGFGNPYTFSRATGAPYTSGTQTGHALKITTTAPTPYGGRIAYRLGPNARITTSGNVDTVHVYIPPPAHESVMQHFSLLDGSRDFEGVVRFNRGSDSMEIDNFGYITSSGHMTANDVYSSNQIVVNNDMTINQTLEANDVTAYTLQALRFCYGGQPC